MRILWPMAAATRLDLQAGRNESLWPDLVTAPHSDALLPFFFDGGVQT
jgi:hypothetical protein